MFGLLRSLASVFSGSETVAAEEPEPREQVEAEEEEEDVLVVASILWKDSKRPRSPESQEIETPGVPEQPAAKVQAIEEDDDVLPRSPPPAQREPCGSVKLPVPSGVPLIKVLDDENPLESTAACNVRKSAKRAPGAIVP